MQSDPNCAFCNVVSGKFPSHKLYEDDLVIVILSIDPMRPGHSLVIPKEHWSKVWSIKDDEIYDRVMRVARDIANALNKTFKPEHVLELAEGIEVQHAHFHLIPSEKGYGELGAEHVAKDPDHQELEKLAKKIRASL